MLGAPFAPSTADTGSGAVRQADGAQNGPLDPASAFEQYRSSGVKAVIHTRELMVSARHGETPRTIRASSPCHLSAAAVHAAPRCPSQPGKCLISRNLWTTWFAASAGPTNRLDPATL